MGWLLNKGADQPQEGLVLRTSRAAIQKRAKFNLTGLSARWIAGDMLDESMPNLRVARDIPATAVRARMELSLIKDHAAALHPL